MFKKYLLAAVVAYVAMCALDMAFQYLYFMKIYEQTPNLWRPMAEMKFAVSYITGFIAFLLYAYIYYRLVDRKSTKNGVIYGLIFGLAYGLMWGYGSYSFMPLPYSLAIGWFLCSTIEFTFSGWILGMMIKEKSK